MVPVHSLDLTVGPWVLRLGRTMFDVIPGAGELESMGPEALTVGECLLDQRHGRPSGARRGELDAIVGKYRVSHWGRRRSGAAEVSRDGGGGVLVQFDEGELRGAVNGDEHVQLTLLSPHLRDINVEVADRVASELLLRRPVTCYVRQAADAVALQAAMQ